MIHMTSDKKRFSVYRLGLTVLVALVMIALLTQSPCSAATTKQKIFASPEEAVKALFNALKNNNGNELTAIFGLIGKGVISSGDAVADRKEVERFVKSYEQKSKIETFGDKKAVLYVGQDEWPFPIPMLKKGEHWLFDTKEGKEEMLNRRIGRNELSAIQVCLAYVDAQREYALKDYDRDGLFEYAQKFFSDPVKKDGLYWEAKEGEEQSPLGVLVANAVTEGYTSKTLHGNPTPYHGYYYRILTAQGKHAPKGSFNYIVSNKMIGGFALVAYPAKHGNSGIMTFIVNQDGLVYQKNLGKNTEKAAKAMKVFDPDKTWKKVQNQ